MLETRGEEPLVLLVDDNVDLLHLAQLILEHFGFRVVTAVDGQRALDMLETIRPDVIVTDMMMPVLDGLAFMKAYARRPVPHASIVAVSAFRTYLDQARELGAAALLEKPYEVTALASMLVGLVGGRRPASALLAAERDETARLQAVLELKFEHPEPSLQPFIDDVATIFDVPVAALVVITHDWQKVVMQSATATPDFEGPRERSICTHAVAARAALVIQDAHDNPCFRTNPVVTERGFRFYAGIPLMPAQGEAVGTLCILDYQPRHFSFLDLELLGLLSRKVLASLEWGLERRNPDSPSSGYRYLPLVDAEFDIYGNALFSDLVAVWTARSVERGEPVAIAAVAVAPDRLRHTIEQLRTVTRGGQIGRLGCCRLGVIAPGNTAEELLAALRTVIGDAPCVAVDLAPYWGAAGQALRYVEQGLGRAGLDAGAGNDHPGSSR